MILGSVLSSFSGWLLERDTWWQLPSHRHLTTSSHRSLDCGLKVTRTEGKMHIETRTCYQN